MKSILTGVILGLFVSPLSAQMFGLGDDSPVEVATALPSGDTFGLHEAVAVNVTKVDTFRDYAAPVYETVNVTTHETICGPNGCEQVPIVSQVRRLFSGVANAVAAPFTGDVCPCGCGIDGCQCGMGGAANVSVAGPPPSGFHDHTDSAGNTWRPEHGMNGNTSAHVSPYNGELVLNRSADGGGEYLRAGRVRFAPLRGIRARFSLRR